MKIDPRPKQGAAPHIFPRCLWVWQAYCDLSERRGVGPNGPVAITLEAMEAYTRMTNRTERFYVDQLMYFIPALDRVYLRDFYEKQSTEIEKARKKAEQPQQKARIGR